MGGVGSGPALSGARLLVGAAIFGIVHTAAFQALWRMTPESTDDYLAWTQRLLVIEGIVSLLAAVVVWVGLGMIAKLPPARTHAHRAIGLRVVGEGISSGWYLWD